MNQNLIVICMIAFILGYLVSRHMGSGFSVGCVVAKCDPQAKTQQFCPGIACPDSGDCLDPNDIGCDKCLKRVLPDGFQMAYNVSGSIPDELSYYKSINETYKFNGYLYNKIPSYQYPTTAPGPSTIDGPSLIYHRNRWRIVESWATDKRFGNFYTHCKKKTDRWTSPDKCTEWSKQPNLTITPVPN